MSTPVLSVENLTVSFRRDGGWHPVVRNVSFDIGAKETLAVVGESGSGKSVTALAIMRLLDRRSARVEGHILLDGKDLLSRSVTEMQSVRGNAMAMIFQEPMTSLNPVMTAGSQIAEALIYHRGISKSEARREAVRLLEKVRIPAAAARAGEYPHQFSGGMRQRVMIAMALACRPRLLIADEPTTALDVTIQAQILDLIKVLQDEEGMSVLFITHDMGVVAEIADRTVVMYRGDAVETGETGSIFARPAKPYTKALLSAVPVLGSMRDADRPLPFPTLDPATGEALPTPTRPDSLDLAEKPVLTVSNLTTRFNVRSGPLGRVSARVHAVENVSFTLQAGETLALVGESGCGKSTTGRSIMRLVEPTSGSIVLNGEEIIGVPRQRLVELRRTMQMIFQDPFASLNPRIRTGDAISEPLRIHGMGDSRSHREKVASLLTEVGLSPDMANRYPHEFSGGQRQRISIARALAMNPRLIIADESVSALDVSVKAQVLNLMLDLQQKFKVAYLFISHDMAVVERVSHRVAVMYLGEIVEIGPRPAIFGNPRHAYTKRLLSAVPVPDPSKRGERAPIAIEEIRSPVRPAGYIAPTRRYQEVGPGHLIMTE